MEIYSVEPGQLDKKNVVDILFFCSWFLGLYLHAEFEGWKHCLSTQACRLKTAP